MEQQKLKDKNLYAGEDVQTILLSLSYGDQYPNEYNQAIQELHNRYMEFISNASMLACRFFSNPSELAQDIAGNTFVTACEKAVEFEPRETFDEEREFKAWLVGIVKEQLKYFTTHNPERQFHSSVGELSIGLSAGDEQQDDELFVKEDDYPITKESAREALNSLKPRDKDIVMAYLNHVHRKNAHLPDDIMQDLCLRYKTTPFNVRQVKYRFFKKVRMLNGGKASL
ncbi:hypothetical protein CLV24_105141 [Pontibacter ummariensis]|uniref:Uncharacterized protein n=1 Tax=Pontibacter ummariensis TaxID=1610492 RepID=A0A239DT43_9BACT|nr:sigma-70 family RNA polymerase sigma factor [Pontibacter ummariensis]PRY13771.1 hypothetical protein CLV24_105141 [Pontibacter ummariensis]SNS35517.1 hypothetical protein SAMN06296052_105111 [Pontibacter ummariensis]